VATPAQLVEALSEATGVPMPTVVDIDRKLVAACLRTKSGRGLSVAHMRALDAARLITAILAAPQANQSAAAVKRYAETQADPERSSDGFFAATGIKDLAALPPRHSFVEALAALIDSATVGDLRKLTGAATEEVRPRIEVFAFTQATYGRIRIFGLPNGRAALVEYVQARSVTRARAGKAPRTKGDGAVRGDLEQSRRITERTILSVSKILAKGNRDERP
jgi:hypothetical protein